MVKSARLLLVAALLAVVGACGPTKPEPAVAPMAALPEPPPPPMMVPSMPPSPAAARRPQLLETAQLRQKAPPRDGASGRREDRKAHESREVLQEKEVASHQGREGVEAACAGPDEDGVARKPTQVPLDSPPRPPRCPQPLPPAAASAVAGPALIASCIKRARHSPRPFFCAGSEGRFSSNASDIERRNRNRRGGHRPRRSGASPDRAAGRAGDARRCCAPDRCTGWSRS